MTAPSAGTDRSRNLPGLILGLLMALSSAVIPNLGTDASVADDTTAQAVVAEGVTGSGLDEIRAMLAEIVEAPEGPREGYDRELFRHWVDADGDGCDTREEVLIEESLVPATVGSGCTVSVGEWFSPYDARTFVAPGGLDIDHMVPLGEAWDSSASEWDELRRQEYANDLDHPEALIAVSAGSNRSKSDRDPAEWKPTNVDHWCRYASEWVTVKFLWGLTADAAEKLALEEMLVTCEAGLS